MIVISFFAFLLLLMLLPFLPALIEISRKKDAQPLNVTQGYNVDIHHFANSFRNFIAMHFSEDLAIINNQIEAKQGSYDDGSSYCLLREQDAISFSEAVLKKQITYEMFIASRSMQMPGAMVYLNECYAGDNIEGANGNIYRALLAGGNISIANDSMSLRWMHADKNIHVDNNCILHGRVSAHDKIYLAENIIFERLYAPSIVFGDDLPTHKATEPCKTIEPKDLSVKVEVSANRWLIEDDVVLPDNSLIDADLVVVGKLTLGNNCKINGSIKSHKLMQINSGCDIRGSVICIQDINVEANSVLTGPIVSEAKIDIADNCQIGFADNATTITAEEIYIKANTVAHGTVWARQQGRAL